MTLRRELIVLTIGDLVKDLLDHEGDEELPSGEMEQAIASGEITIEEMVLIFETALRKEVSLPLDDTSYHAGQATHAFRMRKIHLHAAEIAAAL